MQPPILSTRDDFEYWLANMDDVIESFIASLPSQVRQRLDFSPPSLDVVEAVILQSYTDTDAMLRSDQAQTVNGFACYVGETLRQALGSKWDIRLDDPKFAFVGLPILVGSPNQSAPLCPLTMITAAADRRTGIYLRTIVENVSRR